MVMAVLDELMIFERNHRRDDLAWAYLCRDNHRRELNRCIRNNDFADGETVESIVSDFRARYSDYGPSAA
jgi:hypothetical protein